MIWVGLDNDGPGRGASEQLMEKYFRLGYEVEDISLPVSFKDYNEWLLFERKKNVNRRIREPDTDPSESKVNAD